MTNNSTADMLDNQDLVKLANQRMPFGKYKDHLLIDIPEEYFLWFAQKGFPDSQLGQLMALCLEIKTNELEYLLRPLINAEK